MFKLLPDEIPERVDITIDGRAVQAFEGEPLALALLRLADAPYRVESVGNTPRAPYCLIGVCFECLVQIDGVRDRQACLVPVRAGMQVQRQLELRDIGHATRPEPQR